MNNVLQVMRSLMLDYW